MCWRLRDPDGDLVDSVGYGSSTNAFVETSDDGWLWHRYELQDALCTWPGRRDVSFAVRDPSDRGECVAIVPAHVTTRRVAGLVRWSSIESRCNAFCIGRMPFR